MARPEDMEYIIAPQCTSEDGCHVAASCDQPFIMRCSVCGERFYLISETAFREAGLYAVGRPLLKDLS
jgi:hypothetical protein